MIPKDRQVVYLAPDSDDEEAEPVAIYPYKLAKEQEAANEPSTPKTTRSILKSNKGVSRPKRWLSFAKKMNKKTADARIYSLESGRTEGSSRSLFSDDVSDSALSQDNNTIIHDHMMTGLTTPLPSATKPKKRLQFGCNRVVFFDKRSPATTPFVEQAKPRNRWGSVNRKNRLQQQPHVAVLLPKMPIRMESFSSNQSFASRDGNNSIASSSNSSVSSSSFLGSDGSYGDGSSSLLSLADESSDEISLSSLASQ